MTSLGLLAYICSHHTVYIDLANLYDLPMVGLSIEFVKGKLPASV